MNGVAGLIRLGDIVTTVQTPMTDVMDHGVPSDRTAQPTA